MQFPTMKKAIGIDNTRPIYECNLGLTYQNLGQWEKAIEHYARAVELRKKTPLTPMGWITTMDILLSILQGRQTEGV